MSGDMCNVLICNAGSSSIKFSLIEAARERLIAQADIEWAGGSGSLCVRRGEQPAVRKQLSLASHADAVTHALAELSLENVQAVGHRVVHGGDRYTAAVRITPEVVNDIQKLAELAPLHNSASLQVIDAVQRILPRVPQVAAFDTAFHATMSDAARTYPLPYLWTSDWGLRRYGFHGLSHSYCTARAAQMTGRRDERLIIAHLGNGASISAVRDGACR
jgi:acetate kinase